MVQNESKQSFLNFLHKKGKKGKIEKLYFDLLINLKLKQKTNPNFVINKTLNLLKPKLQLKKISKYKSKIIPVTKAQQIRTSLKWLTHSFLTTKKNKLKTLTTEIIDTLNKTSVSYKQKRKHYQEIRKLRFTLRYKPQIIKFKLKRKGQKSKIQLQKKKFFNIQKLKIQRTRRI